MLEATTRNSWSNYVNEMLTGTDNHASNRKIMKLWRMVKELLLLLLFLAIVVGFAIDSMNHAVRRMDYESATKEKK